MNKTIKILFLIVVFLFGASLFLFIFNQDNKNKYKEQLNLYDAITDSLKTYKVNDSLNAAKIQVMQTESEKDFLKIKNLERTNLELQNLIKNKNKEINRLNTALIHKSETVIRDTTRMFYPVGGDTIILSKSLLLDIINNKWYDATFGFRYGFSYLDLKIRNQYNITIGYEGKTLFKRGTPYAEIINLNPFTYTSDMRVYQVTLPKPKRFGLSFQTGFGGLYDLNSNKFGYGIYGGIGFQYNILQW